VGVGEDEGKKKKKKPPPLPKKEEKERRREGKKEEKRLRCDVTTARIRRSYTTYACTHEG